MRTTEIIKKLLFILFIVWHFTSHGQTGNSFELAGSINRMSGTVRLYPVGNLQDYSNRVLFSDVPVANGRFQISGKINNPAEVFLGLQIGGTVKYISGNFFIEPGNQTISCNADSVREIPGIRNASMIEYMSNYRSVRYEAIDTIDDYLTRNHLQRIYLYEYAKKYPGSYVALWEISNYLKEGYNRILDSAFGILSRPLQISETGIMIQASLNQLKLTDTGRVFPNITVYDQTGKAHQITYDNKKTKYILIDFWFSHCAPCLGQFPEYKKILGQYREKGFKIIGISSDFTASDIDAWKKVIIDYSISWDQYRASAATMSDLRIFGAPYNFILDGNGKIVAKDLNTKEVFAFLQARLN